MTFTLTKYLENIVPVVVVVVIVVVVVVVLGWVFFLPGLSVYRQK